MQALLLCAGALVPATVAHAQDGRTYLPGDIVVTGETPGYVLEDGSSGTKTPTPLVDVPQAISVITRDQLDDQGQTRLNDALRFVPGVSMESGEGNRDAVFIRGQESTADFYIDGLRDDAQYYRSLYNVERVEVLKGANALIFGRGGGGGAVNRIAKRADLMGGFTALAAGIDTEGAWNASADINQPLTANIAGRLNATYETFDSHRQFYDGRFIGISPTLNAELGPDTSLAVHYTYDDDDRLADRGIPSFGGMPIEGYDETLFGDPDYNRSQVQAHILRGRIDHRLSDGVSFNATAQFADYDKFYANIVPSGTDGTEATLVGYQNANNRQNFIGQANFVAQFDTGSIGHTLLAGVEAISQKSDSSRDRAVFGGQTSVSVLLAETITVPAFTLEPQRASESDLTTTSVYIQDQVEIGEFLQLIAGIRYESFDLETSDFVAAFNAQRKDTKWSPRFGVVLKPVEAVSIYGSYSQSFLPQSGDQFSVLNATSVTLEPEEFENFEIGAKWAIQPELLLTAALFRLERSNSTAPDPDNPGFVIQTGETRVEGFELSLAGDVLSNLHVNLGYTYLDGEVTSDTSSAVAGTRLEQLPEHQIGAWARYDISRRLGVGAGIVHQSEQFASLSNQVVLPAYTRVDAAVFFDVTEQLALQLNVENLFDTAYYASAHGDNNIQPGEPISATLGAKLRF